MTKLEKKIQKLLEKRKFSEALETVRKILQKAKSQHYAEYIRLLAVILDHLEGAHESLVPLILEYVDLNINNPDWIRRRNVIGILQSLAKGFPSTFISKNYLSTLKKTCSEDPNWEVRAAIVEVYGRLGDHTPERTYYLLKDCLADEDEDVRKTVLDQLLRFLTKHPEFITDLFPILKKMKNSESNWEISNSVGVMIETLKPLQIPNTVTVDLTQETYICLLCGKPYTQLGNICLSCGKEFPRCMICKEVIRLKPDSTIAYCPHCKALAHPDHLKSWVRSKSNCPACMNPLHENQIKLLRKST
jgi:hypothetical protein